MQSYRIWNDLNSKNYIGATKRTAHDRWKEHRRAAECGIHSKLYDEMREIGIDKFHMEVILETDSFEELYTSETENIEKYNSVLEGYNVQSRSPIRESWQEFYDNLKDVMSNQSTREKISVSMKKSIADRGGMSERHRRRLSKSAMGNKNGIGNLSHSIGCYCIDENGVEHQFSSYKEGGIWWYENYRPFGETYSSATYQRKIISCIDTGSCEFYGKHYEFPIKWYRNNRV